MNRFFGRQADTRAYRLRYALSALFELFAVLCQLHKQNSLVAFAAETADKESTFTESRSMRIFNVGIREVILLLVIMLILFGPRQMQENARNLAKWIRKLVRSDTWRTFLGLVDDVNTIKDQVIRESGIKEVQDSLRGVNRQLGEIDADLRRTDLSDIKETETETSAEEDEQGSHE